MIEFPCPHCGRGLKAPPKLAGHRAKCSRCERPVTVPLPDDWQTAPTFESIENLAVEAVGPSPSVFERLDANEVQQLVAMEAKSKAAQPEPVVPPFEFQLVRQPIAWRSIFQRIGLIALLVVGVAGYWFLAPSGRRGLPLLSYASAVAALIAATMLLAWSLRSRTKAVRGWLISFAAVGGFAWWLWMITHDQYVETRWDAPDGWKNASRLDITRDRWTDKPTWLKIRIYGEQFSELVPEATGEGPVAPSGARHGDWLHYEFFGTNSRRVYFWYDEEITEGEWHLRNRD